MHFSLLVFIFFVPNFERFHAQDYHVKDFGAVGDGITDDTTAIRKAMQAANDSNGGRVIFDKGFTFFTGCFRIPNNTIVEVNGEILGATSNDHYVYPGSPGIHPDSEWQPFVFSFDASNITITGGGLIDGQGQIWWNCIVNESLEPCIHKTNPRLIGLMSTSNILVYNITLRNSPFYNLGLINSTNIHVHNITILNPNSCWGACPPGFNASHNTDGVNMINVKNVLVENSYISTGDDAIAIYSYGNTPSENIVVRNLFVGMSHGLSIGSTTIGGMQNITFDNITISPPHQIQMQMFNGIRVKSNRGRGGGLVHNISYSNIQMYNISVCIRIDMNYCQSYHPPTNQSLTPHFQDIKIRDIYCENATYGYYLDGLDDSEINANFSNIQLKNVTHVYQKCNNIYGSCDNSTVFPECPPCMGMTECQDSSEDCAAYLGQCQNPAYKDTLCKLCRNSCKLCNSCSNTMEFSPFLHQDPNPGIHALC